MADEIRPESDNDASQRDARAMSVSSPEAGAQTPPGPQPSADPPIVSVRHVDLFFGQEQVLYDVCLDIPRGQVTALMGASGCGKSTLLRCFNRMIDLTEDHRVAGKIIFDGVDVLNAGTDVYGLRRRVGMVFDAPTPFSKSVYENAAYGLRVEGVRDPGELEDRVVAALKRTRLWNEVRERLHASASKLSARQQQQLCIARAIAVNPDVLLLDEPCSTLDPRSTTRIEDLIGELSGDLTIVIVTHNMQQASRVSEWTAYMVDGRVIEHGPTRQLFTTPARPETEEYITGRLG